MIALSIGATAVAHGIHYGVLGVGLLGLLALLGPQLVGGRQAAPAGDQHSLRVRELTEQLAAGGPGPRVQALPTAPVRRGPADPVRNRFLPMAVVSSAAAAGVHAAVGPTHFREQVLFGLFFAGSALAQIVWSLAVATRPTRALLVAAVIGNSAILLLWSITRTVGLPGLLPGPEAVGPWDLCCAVWELGVVLFAARALHVETGGDLRLAEWRDWEPMPRAWAFGSALALLLLTLVGAGA